MWGVLSGGTFNVSTGGTAHDFTVSSGGTANVLGSVTSNNAVLAGGVENISSGGVVSGVPNSGTGISGGIVNVLSSGALDHATVFQRRNAERFPRVEPRTTLPYRVAAPRNVLGTVTSDKRGGGRRGREHLIRRCGHRRSQLPALAFPGALSMCFRAAHSIMRLFTSGGTLNVSAGGTATQTSTISSGGTANVAGTITSNVGVDAGGVENVFIRRSDHLACPVPAPVFPAAS